MAGSNRRAALLAIHGPAPRTRRSKGLSARTPFRAWFRPPFRGVKIGGLLALCRYSAYSTNDKVDWVPSDTSRPFSKPESGRIAVKAINHLGDEVMKVVKVQSGGRALDDLHTASHIRRPRGES